MSGPTLTYFAILLSKIGERTLTKELIHDHVAHLARLDDEGKLVLSGPFSDHPSGLVVIKAANKDEATRIAESDPFVRSGARAFEVRTWLIANRENGYLG